MPRSRIWKPPATAASATSATAPGCSPPPSAWPASAATRRSCAWTSPSCEAAQQAARELLEAADAPTALICGQNRVTIGALHALHALGRQGTIALVGFDDVALGDFLSPGLTVIAQDPFALGRHAAELLFARLEGDDSPPRRIVVPTRLIARGSGEIRPA